MVLFDFQRDFIDAIYNNAQAKDPTAPPARMIEDILFADETGENDTAALTLAMEQARAQGRGKQLDKMLETRSWHRVAKFVAYVCQRKALHLAPRGEQFLEALAERLRGCPEIGDGVVGRTIKELQKQFFDPQGLGHRAGGHYGRWRASCRGNICRHALQSARKTSSINDV
jgi:hypothetical protein